MSAVKTVRDRRAALIDHSTVGKGSNALHQSATDKENAAPDGAVTAGAKLSLSVDVPDESMQSREAEDWWALRSKALRAWIAANPLKLGAASNVFALAPCARRPSSTS